MKRFPFELAALVCLAPLPLAQTESTCGVVGDVDTIGLPTAGSEGLVQLSLEGAVLENHPFQLRVENAAPGALGLVIASFSLTQMFASQFGATIYVGPTAASQAFVVEGDGKSPTLFEAGLLPSSLCGTSFVVQAAVFDPAAQGGAAFTKALSCTIGRAISGPSLADYHQALSGPIQLHVGDISGDGLDDVVSLSSRDEVVVALGDGLGRLGASTTLSVGADASFMGVADWNGDGAPDVLVARIRPDMLTVLYGNGDGTFQPPFDFSPLPSPSMFVIEDIDGDGSPELIAALGTTDEIIVLHANADPPQVYPVGDLPIYVDTGDLNGDTHTDVVVLNRFSGSVSILLSNPDGTLQPAQDTPVGTLPDLIVVGDANGNGKEDVLVVVTAPQSTVDQLLLVFGNGDGTLGPTSVLDSGETYKSIALGDANEDGRGDILYATRTQQFDDQVRILAKNAGSGFSSLPNISIPGTSDVRLSEMTGDATDDLVVMASNFVGVAIIPGTGGGSYELVPTLPIGDNPYEMATADLNGDSIEDLVVVDLTEDRAKILFGDGQGSFELIFKTVSLIEEPTDVEIADLDGDLDQDILFLYDSGLHVLLGNGDGTFDSGTDFSTATFASGLDVGDLNGDGVPDVVTGSFAQNPPQTAVMIGNGDGTFGAPSLHDVGGWPARLYLEDIDGNGTLDLLTWELSNSAWIAMGNGDGTFAVGSGVETGPSGARPKDTLFADVTNDGNKDLVVAMRASNDSWVTVAPGDGAGNFGAWSSWSVGTNAEGLAISDYNGDLITDVAVVSDHGLSLLFGNGSGLDLSADNYGYFSSSFDLVTMDLNGDELADIVVSDARGDDLKFFVNQLMR